MNGRWIEIVQDPDEKGKLSLGRTPLAVGFVLVTLFAGAVGVTLLLSHLGAWGLEPVNYDEAFSSYMDRMLDAFWSLVTIYLGGKGIGKVENVMIGSGD